MAEPRPSMAEPQPRMAEARPTGRIRPGVLVLTTLAIASCGGAGGPPGPPDPVVLLGQAAGRMESVGSFAFLLEHENGATTITRGLQMVRAEGRMVGRDRMEAQLQAMVGPVALEVGVIVLPEGSWMTNPLTGQWVPEAIRVSQFFDPATGVPALMRGIQEATLVGSEVIDGTSAHRIEASVASEALAGLVPQAAPGRAVHVRAWIGEADPVLHQLEIVGGVQEGELETLVRRLTFSEFGSSFTIDPPN